MVIPHYTIGIPRNVLQIYLQPKGLKQSLVHSIQRSTTIARTSESLSIDEMMVKFYGRSIVRQYIKSKPHKFGIKLWSICCACCGYSLTQNIYLGSTVESVGGRDVVLQLSQAYLDKGHVIYCDRFFSHLDLATNLRSRQTGIQNETKGKFCVSDCFYIGIT